MKEHFIAGWGGYPIVGTPEMVDELATMSKMELDGTLLDWPRYIDDQRWFQSNVSAGAAGVLALTVMVWVRRRRQPKTPTTPRSSRG